MVYCKKCGNPMEDSATVCSKCGNKKDTVEYASDSLRNATATTKKLWGRLFNDEYGFETNKFLKTLAKILLIVGCVVLVIGVIGGLVTMIDSGALVGSIIILAAVIVFFISLIGAVNILWFVSIGNNVMHIRQLLEKQGGN
jgi:hypothetical protein